MQALADRYHFTGRADAEAALEEPRRLENMYTHGCQAQLEEASRRAIAAARWLADKREEEVRRYGFAGLLNQMVPS